MSEDYALAACEELTALPTVAKSLKIQINDFINMIRDVGKHFTFHTENLFSHCLLRIDCSAVVRQCLKHGIHAEDAKVSLPFSLSSVFFCLLAGGGGCGAGRWFRRQACI